MSASETPRSKPGAIGLRVKRPLPAPRNAVSVVGRCLAPHASGPIGELGFDQRGWSGSFYGLYALTETAARSLKVVPIIAPVHRDTEIETAITALGREPGGGLVVTAGAFMIGHRAPIILAAARNNVPAVYAASTFARDGGLLSYGPDPVDGDPWRRAATYVDRILRGAKPGDLPVQFPTKFEMVLNLRTATALGLAIGRDRDL